MAKRMIEVDDTLADCVQEVTDGIKEAFTEWMDENPDADSAPDLGNDLNYSGRIDEIVDGAVPIYTYEIDTAHFLHGNDLETAYENAGIGDGKEDNWKAVAIYCYLSQEGAGWYEDEKDDLFDAWKAAHPVAEDADDATTGEESTK